MKFLFITYILALLIFGTAWITNLVKFVQCDFESPWKEEIVHGVGVFVPPTSIITVWF